MGTEVGCGEGSEMLAGTAEGEPCQEAFRLRDKDIPVMEDVLTMEKVPESGHGEVPMVHFQKHTSTNSKSIH